MAKNETKAWYDDIDAATLQRIKTYSAFNDAASKNLMMQTMYEYREKEIQDFKETNHELAETCIARKKRIAELEKENAELTERLSKVENAYKHKSETEWRLNDLYQKVLTDFGNAEKCSREYFSRYRAVLDRLIKAKDLLSELSQLKHRADDPFTCDEYVRDVSLCRCFQSADR